jgi:anti-sigma factor RsiW
MERCKEFAQYLGGYCDGELDSKLAERVRLHLDGCARCAKQYHALKQVSELYRCAAVPEPTEAEWARVSSAIEKSVAAQPAARVRPRRSLWRAWWIYPATGLAVAAAILIAVFLWPAAPPEPATPAPVVAVKVDEIETPSPEFTVSLNLPRHKGDLLSIDVAPAAHRDEDTP